MVNFHEMAEFFEGQDDAMGDPRRCPIHGEPTSSPDGMFDAPCGKCEMEIEYGEDEPNYLDDQSDDADALASAGFGTDDDYDPCLDRGDYDIPF